MLVLGAPMRSAARLFGAYPGPAEGAAIGAVVSLLLRGLLLAAFVALFSLPYVGALGAAALIAWRPCFSVGRAARRRRRRPPTARSRRSLAEAINDPVGALLPARRAGACSSNRAALLFAVRAGAGARRVRRPGRSPRGARCAATPLRAAVAAAALAAALGEMLVAAPPVSGWVGGLTGASRDRSARAGGADARGGLGARRVRQASRGDA